MKALKCYVALLFIGVLFFGAYSNAMAESRFAIDDQSIKDIIDQSTKGSSAFSSKNYTEIAWKVKLHNSSDKPITFDITVAFLDSAKDKLGETTRTSKIKPGESKMVSNLVLMPANQAGQIDSGYVAIEKSGSSVVDTMAQNLFATVGVDNLNKGFVDNSRKLIKIGYNVKLRNTTNKPMTRDINIAFLDENNEQIGEKYFANSWDI